MFFLAHIINLFLFTNTDTDPIIEEFKHYIELNHGEKLILPCKVSGNPLPTVTWFKNHREISFDPYDVSSRVQLGQNNTLIINNISERDEAIYSCRASSRNGKAVVKESNVVIYGNFTFSRMSIFVVVSIE